MAEGAVSAQPVTQAARWACLALVASLPLGRIGTLIGGYWSVLSDLVFLLTAALAGLAWAAGQLRVRWHPAFWLLLFYFLALALSAAFSPDPGRSAVKLVSQAYLLALPVLSWTLLPAGLWLKRAALIWIAAGALLGLLAALVLVLFYLDRDHWLLRHTLFHYGSLPAGNYPRMSLSFGNANMLCTYLAGVLGAVLGARAAGWIGRRSAGLAAGGTLLAMAFTVSPGIGSAFLVLGIWAWWRWRARRPVAAWAALVAGLAGAAAFLLAASLTLAPHPDPAFRLTLPLVGDVYASARVSLWTGAWQTFLAHPWTGAGLAQHSVEYHFLDPQGRQQFLTDAHNMFLNLAAQAGLAGLVAITLICADLVRRTLTAGRTGAALPFALGLGLLSALVYQGLTGSFEDARHLWVLLGMFLVAEDGARRGG